MSGYACRWRRRMAVADSCKVLKQAGRQVDRQAARIRDAAEPAACSFSTQQRSSTTKHRPDVPNTQLAPTATAALMSRKNRQALVW